MKYISTRCGHIEGVSSAYAIKTGLASDGGLFMPREIPSIDLEFIDEISKLSYPEMAAKVLSPTSNPVKHKGEKIYST